MRNLLLVFASFLISSFLISQTWQDVGGGTNNSSHGLLTWNGKLIDLGSFNNPCNRVAAWNGTTWECLGGGVGIVARAGTVWNGNLVVVGDFWNVQQPCTNCNGVAMWDGTQWTNIGAGFNNDVLCVTVWNGDLVVAGDFTQSNGVACSRIAKWNGSTWEQIGPSNAFNNDIRTITEFEGELWIGGDFTNVGGCTACDRLVKWSGTAWVGGDSGVDIQGGVDNTVRVLYVNPYDGKLYMGGHFTDLNIDGVVNPDCKGVAVYDGSVWAPLGTGVNDYVRAINEYNGNIVVGGYFTTAGGNSANRIAKWNPVAQTWSAMGLGFNGAGIDEYVKAATVWNGIFFAGGAYTIAENNPMDFIAQWYEAPAALPTAVINAEQTSLCTGGCFSFTDESTYGPTSWNWSFPGGSITSSTMQDPPPICYSAPGTYTVTLQACNSIGCNTTTQNITVTASSSVTVNNATICGGSSTVLTANPSTSGGTFLWSPGGETTQSITVSPTVTSTYTVTYTTSGCGATNATSTVTVSSTAPTVSVNSPTICSGSSTILTATPSTAGGTYLWYPGNATTQSITVSPTSTQVYTVTYTLSGCSSAPTNTTVTVNPSPTVSVNNETICSGGTATIIATPSSVGGTYLWTPGGQTSSSITVSPTSTTTYSVVYSLNGCSSPSTTSTVTVTPQPTLSVNNATICNGTSATLVATPSVSGGTYSWSPGGQTTQTIVVSPTATTTYTVNYTINGCSSNPAFGIVTVNPIPSVTVNNQTICSGSTTTLTATPSSGGGSYLWSPGGQTSSSITVSPTSTTTYSVAYSQNGCTSPVASGIVTVNQTPVVTVNNETICFGSSATLLATPSIAGGTYLWTPDGQTSSSITVSPTSTTTYSVVYSLNGCSSSSTPSIVTVTPQPTLSVNNVTICNGSSATLVATPSVSGGTYSWSPGGQTTQTIVVSPTATTSYTVNYTLNGCSSNPASGIVTINPTPSVTVNNQTICSGSNATLIATPSSGGGSYLWSLGGETTSSISVSPSSTTTYTVVYTLNGCSSSVVSGIVTVNQTPVVAVNNETICNGSSATLVATPSVSGGTYSWSPGGQTTQSIVVFPTTTTTYTVNYTVNGCSSNPASGIVTVNSSPTITVNNQTICSGNSTTLTATPSIGGGSYIWTPGGETTSSITVSPLSTTTYSVQYSITGCGSSSNSGIITVNPTPTVTVNNETICASETVQLTATPSIAGGTYLWSPDGQITPSISVNPINSTNYSVVYTLNGCESNSATSVVTISPAPSILVNLSQNILTSNQSGASYQWVDCNNSFASVVNETNQTFIATVNGNYAVIVTLNGCSDTSTCTLINTNSFLENSLSDVLSIYPNPTYDNIVITMHPEMIGLEILITDEKGRIIETFKTTEKEIDIKLTSYATGIYFVQLKNMPQTISRVVKL